MQNWGWINNIGHKGNLSIEQKCKGWFTMDRHSDASITYHHRAMLPQTLRGTAQTFVLPWSSCSNIYHYAYRWRMGPFARRSDFGMPGHQAGSQIWTRYCNWCRARNNHIGNLGSNLKSTEPRKKVCTCLRDISSQSLPSFSAWL